MRALDVLVVEDFEPFRRLICSFLQERTDLRLVGEASDGLEAIRKIEELQPDLVLLDIGLPSLNGIEVATRARKAAPHAKLLFISQESTTDVIEKTFQVGGQGYIHKMRVACELLPAIETILDGKQHVSAGLGFSLNARAQALRRHEIFFYSDNTALLDGLCRFIAPALTAGNVVIVVVSEENTERLAERLRLHGANIDAAIQQGAYVLVTASYLLSAFMVDGWPDADRFSAATDYLIRKAAEGPDGERRRVVACGQCAPALWMQGDTEAAIQVEHLLDELSRTHQLDILCAYPLPSEQEKEDDLALQRLRAEHSGVCSS